MKPKISLISMGAGNVLVLKKTLESFSKVCDQIVYGDMLLFPEDREILYSYRKEFNLKIVQLPFDFIFKNGFSNCLNILSAVADNNLIIYANTSEIIEVDNGILETISPEYNAYFFDHSVDKHRWFRTYDKRELKWSGKIHESLVGEYRPYHKPIFRMADLEKDLGDPFKAKVLNSVKEIVYFTNYMAIIDKPEELGGTDPGWIKFAADNYDNMKERLLAKGGMYQAFVDGDYRRFMLEAYSSKEFEKERFESSNMIEFQGDPKYLGKK